MQTVSLVIYWWSIYGCKNKQQKNDYVDILYFKKSEMTITLLFPLFFFFKETQANKNSVDLNVFTYFLFGDTEEQQSPQGHTKNGRNKGPIIYRTNNKSFDYWGVAQWHCFVEEALNGPWKPLVCQPTQHDSTIYTTP